MSFPNDLGRNFPICDDNYYSIFELLLVINNKTKIMFMSKSICVIASCLIWFQFLWSSTVMGKRNRELSKSEVFWWNFWLGP